MGLGETLELEPGVEVVEAVSMGVSAAEFMGLAAVRLELPGDALAALLQGVAGEVVATEGGGEGGELHIIPGAVVVGSAAFGAAGATVLEPGKVF